MTTLSLCHGQPTHRSTLQSVSLISTDIEMPINANKDTDSLAEEIYTYIGMWWQIDTLKIDMQSENEKDARDEPLG